MRKWQEKNLATKRRGGFIRRKSGENSLSISETRLQHVQQVSRLCIHCRSIYSANLDALDSPQVLRAAIFRSRIFIALARRTTELGKRDCSLSTANLSNTFNSIRYASQSKFSMLFSRRWKNKIPFLKCFLQKERKGFSLKVLCMKLIDANSSEIQEIF